MARYWVSFEAWAPEGNNYYVTPHTWVWADSPQHAEVVARQKLGGEVHPNLAMTTCAPFSEEAYQAEMRRYRDYLKSTCGVDLDSLN